MEEADENLFGLVHPASEGKDTEDRPQFANPEYITEAGHEFALLDW